MKKENKKKIYNYKEDEILDAIKEVESSDLSDSLKTIIVSSLNMCLSINSLLVKNRALRRLLERLFGFKTEKKSQKISQKKTKMNLNKKKTPPQT